MSFPFFCLYFFAKTNTIVIGPIRPIYINIIITIFPMTVKVGVSDADKPTVQNAEKTSKIKSIKSAPSFIDNINNPNEQTKKLNIAIVNERFTT